MPGEENSNVSAEWSILDKLDQVDTGTPNPSDPPPEDDKKGQQQLPPDDKKGQQQPPPDDSKAGEDNPFTPGTKQHTKWGELRASEKAAREEADKVKADYAKAQQRLDELEKRPSPDEYEGLKTKLTAQEKELMVTRLEATEAYAEKVGKPLTQVQATVDRLSKVYDLDKDALNDAIAQGDPKLRAQALSKLGANLPGPEQAKLFAAADTFDAMIAAREELVKNADKIIADERTHAENRQRDQATQRIKDTNAAMDSTFMLLAKKSPFFQDQPLMDAVRKEVSNVDFDAVTPNTKAAALIAGASLPHMISHISKQAQEIAALQAQVKALTGSEPNPGDSQRGGGNVPDVSEGGFMDSIERGLARR
jgi:hypothetical protein